MVGVWLWFNRCCIDCCITHPNLSLLHVFIVQIWMCPNGFSTCAQACFGSSCIPFRRSCAHEPGVLSCTVDSVRRWAAEVPRRTTEMYGRSLVMMHHTQPGNPKQNDLYSALQGVFRACSYRKVGTSSFSRDHLTVNRSYHPTDNIDEGA